MIDPQEFFLLEAIAHARTMKLSESVVFLRGLLQCCSDSPAKEVVQKIYIPLSESDRQLELLQTGQLRFDDLLQKGGS